MCDDTNILVMVLSESNKKYASMTIQKDGTEEKICNCKKSRTSIAPLGKPYFQEIEQCRDEILCKIHHSEPSEV